MERRAEGWRMREYGHDGLQRHEEEAVEGLRTGKASGLLMRVLEEKSRTLPQMFERLGGDTQEVREWKWSARTPDK
jgi:hypothetical protein